MRCTARWDVLDCFYDLSIPDELQTVAARHRQHLAELILKLRSLGFDEEAVGRSVDQLIASYRAELLEAIKTLGGFCRD